MALERRLFVRFSMSSTVVLQPEKDDSFRVECELCDLSFEGMGLYAPRQLLIDHVRFSIVNKTQRLELTGIARIVFCKATSYNGKNCFRIGLEFVDVDFDKVRFILEGLSSDAPESPKAG